MSARVLPFLHLHRLCGAFLLLAFLAGEQTLASPGDARLTARPGQPTEPFAPGLTDLGLARKRDGFVYVPSNYVPTKPAPLLVLLHGAGGSAKRAWTAYAKMAEPRGLIVLAIDSRWRTWDAIQHRWGDDVTFIDAALAHVFARHRIDPAQVALAGFSDGASYALSLGAANGDLFTHVVAFAPASIRPVLPRGQPRIFISHGTRDDILSVELSRRGIVPTLRQAGYDVTYRETDLGHEVDWNISIEMLTWFLGR